MKSERQKYQFGIRIKNEKTNNSAATKAVLDCKEIFASQGYQDWSLYFPDNSNRIKYVLSICRELGKFLFHIKKGSLVGVQYPLLNNVFKYFIKAAKLKKVKVFCVIHDIESLRAGSKSEELVIQEVSNFNYYDYLIVHNRCMLQWLKNKGVKTKMFPLLVFDYLSSGDLKNNLSSNFNKTIVFAGNLSKSNFIYLLDEIDWTFNLYGPNYNHNLERPLNVTYVGQFSPSQIVHELEGQFGLIWDGNRLDKCDEVLGNYLKYNNPHKFSLYIAAGLPVIAPKESAIGQLITQFNIGILISSLTELNDLSIMTDEYNLMKKNCLEIRKDVIRGNFFTTALHTIEQELI